MGNIKGEEGAGSCIRWK